MWLNMFNLKYWSYVIDIRKKHGHVLICGELLLITKRHFPPCNISTLINQHIHVQIKFSSIKISSKWQEFGSVCFVLGVSTSSRFNILNHLSQNHLNQIIWGISNLKPNGSRYLQIVSHAFVVMWFDINQYSVVTFVLFFNTEV